MGRNMLVRVQVEDQSGVGVVELNDPQRFNTMSSALGDDMLLAVVYLHKRRDDLRAIVLQGAGSVFCAGGNPYGSTGPVSLTSASHSFRHRLRVNTIFILTSASHSS